MRLYQLILCRFSSSNILEDAVGGRGESLWMNRKPTAAVEGSFWLACRDYIHSSCYALHTATSDFKPSHPPTSSPKPLLSSAINHHLATGQWARSKVTLTLLPTQLEVGNGDREKGGKERKREGRAIGREQGGKNERASVWVYLSTLLSQWEGNLWCKLY